MQHFGLFFGTNACGLICASQVNRRLLRCFSAQQILNAAFTASAAVGLMVTTGIGAFLAQVTLIFICLCMTGLLYPNETAVPMTATMTVWRVVGRCAAAGVAHAPLARFARGRQN